MMIDEANDVLGIVESVIGVDLESANTVRQAGVRC
jgi:hypothetical protein